MLRFFVPNLTFSIIFYLFAIFILEEMIDYFIHFSLSLIIFDKIPYLKIFSSNYLKFMAIIITYNINKYDR